MIFEWSIFFVFILAVGIIWQNKILGLIGLGCGFWLIRVRERVDKLPKPKKKPKPKTSTR